MKTMRNLGWGTRRLESILKILGLGVILYTAIMGTQSIVLSAGNDVPDFEGLRWGMKKADVAKFFKKYSPHIWEGGGVKSDEYKNANLAISFDKPFRIHEINSTRTLIYFDNKTNGLVGISFGGRKKVTVEKFYSLSRKLEKNFGKPRNGGEEDRLWNSWLVGSTEIRAKIHVGIGILSLSYSEAGKRMK